MSHFDAGTGQIVANAAESERANFIKRTYVHLAGAIAVFAIIETLLLRSGVADSFVHMLSGSRWSWLIVLGAFMLVSTVAVVLVGMITMASDLLLRGSIFGRSGKKGNAIVLVIGLILAILMPLIGSLLRMAISRKRELLADATGAMLTRYPEGLASALEKIHAHGSKMKTANHATAHLFIANPFGVKRMKTDVNRLFMTHPSPDLRIKLLREMDAENPLPPLP